MVEHGMRGACVAAFNFDCLHQLLTSNMETGLPAGPTHADKWRTVAVSPLMPLLCLIFLSIASIVIVLRCVMGRQEQPLSAKSRDACQ